MVSSKKAIFLDRDGVINDNSRYYTFRREDFVLNPGVIEALTELKANGFSFIVITNQSGISKGVYKKEDVECLHAYMTSLFANHGIEFLELYYCTHHSDNENCLCRKPASLLIEKGIARFNLNKDLCWVIGDSARDIEAGKSAGIRGILTKPNADLREVLPFILQ